MLSARLQVFAAAVLFSTGGAAIKSIQLTAWQVAGFRAGLAALAILLFLPAARRMFDRRILLAGIAYAAMGLTFVAANKYTTAANAIFLQDTAPVYMMALSPLLLKEAVPRRDRVFLVLMAAGAAMFFAGDPAPSLTAPDPARGNLIALASAAAWASTIAALRWMEKSGIEGQPGMATVAMGNLLAFGASLPWALPVASISARDAGVLAYLGFVQIALGYALFTRGVKHASGMEASVIMMCEPALCALWAFLIHGETPAPWGLAGGAVILAATAGRVLFR